MKLFISQLMRGKSDELILLEREEVLRIMKKRYPDAEISVIDSFFTDNKMTPLECLGESLKLMSQADTVVFAKGWFDGRGCKIEHDAAGYYGIRIEYI